MDIAQYVPGTGKAVITGYVPSSSRLDDYLRQLANVTNSEHLTAEQKQQIIAQILAAMEQVNN